MSPFEIAVPLSTPLQGVAGPIIAVRVRPVDPEYRQRRPRDVDETLWTFAQYTGLPHWVAKHVSEPDFVAVVAAIDELRARIDRTIAHLDAAAAPNPPPPHREESTAL